MAASYSINNGKLVQSEINEIVPSLKDTEEDNELLSVDSSTAPKVFGWKDCREVLVNYYPQKVPHIIDFIENTLSTVPRTRRNFVPQDIYKKIVLEIFDTAGMSEKMAAQEYEKVRVDKIEKYSIRTVFDFLNKLAPLTERQNPPAEVLASYYIFLERISRGKSSGLYLANVIFATVLQLSILAFLCTVWYFNVKEIFDNRKTQFPNTAYFCLAILVLFIADDILKSSVSSNVLPLTTFGTRRWLTSEAASIKFQAPIALAILAIGTVFLITTRDGLDILFNCGSFVIFLQIDGIIIFLFARLTNLKLDMELLHPHLQKFTSRSSRWLVVFLMIICAIGCITIVTTYEFANEGDLTTGFGQEDVDDGEICCWYDAASLKEEVSHCFPIKNVETGWCCGTKLCKSPEKCFSAEESNLTTCAEDPNPVPYQLYCLAGVCILQVVLMIFVKVMLPKDTISRVPFESKKK
eukprot:CAMPEP_0114981150 /NCGR_PEP_ID=MMETSP0216-20121206/5376_1 /TAXON_ID=223996 /ORGANISM="Protocruzia adherens, Strain Boccale" /LENGTH=465 /DNA_ID=CAMNT_0002342773 /DNA_START=129 /DNA_END=1526 /DNA_ORIENTATION=-